MTTRMTRIVPLLLAMACLPSSLTAEKAPAKAGSFADRVERFHGLRMGFQLPAHLGEKDAPRLGKGSPDEFDPARYFEIFDHVTMEPGFVLDWVYDFEFLGGEPVLYARKVGDPAFRRISELRAAVRVEAQLDEVDKIDEAFRKKLKEAREAEGFGESWDKVWNEWQQALAKFPRRLYQDWWKEHVRCDGTDEGFKELAAVCRLADQFALYWHACRNDTRILADGRMLPAIAQVKPHREIFTKAKDELIPEEIREQASKLDPSPQVRREDGKVFVTFLTFSQWGGLTRRTFEISAKPPHTVKENAAKTEVHWDCGITF